MWKKKLLFIYSIIILIFIISFFIYQKNFKKVKKVEIIKLEKEEPSYNSNIIKDIEYISKDSKGNEYIIRAREGEIDYSEPDIIFLKNVTALIKLKNSNNITITSDYGKYNSINYDTIFTKNVVIDYLENNVTGEYLDFSLVRNSMIISRKVVYTNLENVLKSDVVEINIETKDTKIFMYEKEKKVNVTNKK
tara:strand:+ start:31 stop:606 length:576 start_codon:yes stop_codon:yes gene_type:complete